MAISLHELVSYTDRLLEKGQFSDYCPNGLQVEASTEIKKIISGVTASQALIDVAIARKADAIFVHHGYFWKGEAAEITGIKAKRIASLIKNNISLIAYHLPLDAHPVVGNNSQLAKLLGFKTDVDAEGNPRGIGPDGLIQTGSLETPLPLEQITKHIAEKLQREPFVVGNAQQLVHRLAWCTGGAQGFMADAIDVGVDLYISGEVSEPNYHYAQETATAYIGAGHHATERYGVKALGEKIAAQFGIKVQFLDINNPI